MVVSSSLNQGQRSNSSRFWRELSERHTLLRRATEGTRLFTNITDEWHAAVQHKSFRWLHQDGHLKLTSTNYTGTLRQLLKMEEAHVAIEQRKYDMFRQRLVIKHALDAEGNPTAKLVQYGISVNGLADMEPKLFKDDYVILRSQEGVFKLTTIERIENNLVVLPSGRFHANEEFLSGLLDIHFVSRGFLFQFFEKALQRFDQDPILRARLFQYEHELFGVIRPVYKPFDPLVRIDCDAPEADDRLWQLNAHQQRAILNILECTSWPKPYILFGPPGTGKTHTLAETIAQIYVCMSRSRTLYCANSNTCVDQMDDKLHAIPLIFTHDIKRLYAGQKPNTIGSSRIVLTTNMKSAGLMDKFQFDFVIIDEAGHAHQPETLIPISCVKKGGCLVLAGDPKQLGPVIKCEEANKYGLGVSLLERLFNSDIYKRDSTTGQYNSKYITKLLISYRCDPRVLAIPNKLFYDNELKCANQTPKSILKIMNITNPLQFFCVNGEAEQPNLSTSWHNFGEAKRCVDLIVRLYKMGLTPDQVGVISPYKLQAELIRKKLDQKLNSYRDFLERRFSMNTRVEQVERYREAHLVTIPVIEPVSHSGVWSILSKVLSKFYNFNKRAAYTTSTVYAEKVRHEVFYKDERRDDRWLCKIDSVDAFQGDEREVIIISTVRTPSKGRTDFINDDRRFNVAISRAKWLVFVIGHKVALERQSNWSEFLSSSSSEMSKWPKQSASDLSQPFKQFGSLFK